MNSQTLGPKSQVHHWLKVAPTVPELLKFCPGNGHYHVSNN